MNLSAIAIRRPVFTVMVMTGLIILGVTGYQRLGADLYPNVSFPAIVVTVPYPGASPADVESAVIKPLENAVISLNGIDRVRALAREGSAQVFVMFELGVPIDVAAEGVRERVSQVRHQFPLQVEEPLIQRFDLASTPILTYTLRGQDSLSALHTYAEDVLGPAIEQVAGVAAAQVKGGARREVQIELDKARLDALRLSPAVIVQRLRRENTNLPAGQFEEGPREVSVRVLAEYENIAQLRESIVATTADGSSVRLKDIARVVDGFEEQRTLIRVNRKQAVTLDVRKQSGWNTVDVARAVKARMEQLQRSLPEQIELELVVDQSRHIERQVALVQEDLIAGALMAVLVVLVFMLDLRSTLISALALPTSVVGTFFAMYVLGYSLNMMTLLALSLSIGLLIDDAVVVRENIFKHIQAGKSPRQAALDGTNEVSLSVLATTLTVIAVFMPIAFVPGLTGKFLREFGTTVSVAVAISLFVAFTLDPMLSSRIAHKPSEQRSRFAALKMPFEWVHEQVDQTYRLALRYSVRHKAVVALLALASIALTGFVVGKMGQEFINPEDHAQFMLEAELPAGTSLSETARLTEAVEAELLAKPEFRTLVATIGSDGQANVVKWFVLATNKLDRELSLRELKTYATSAVNKLPGAKAAVTAPPMFEGSSIAAPIMINVRGSSYDSLLQSATQVAEVLRTTRGVSNVQLRYSPGRPELAVELDRVRAADRGITAAEVAATLRTAVAGEEAGQMRQSGASEDIPIRVRLDQRYRGDVASLNAITLPTAAGAIPLSDIAKIKRSDGPQVIERDNKMRQITLWASPDGRPLGDTAKDFKPRIQALALPDGVSIAYDGDLRLMDENNQGVGAALLLGIAFIYIVLASQFESFLHPVTIMVTLPLAMVGAILALFLTNQTLALGAMFGMILLIGLVTKNAILLIDRAIVRVRDYGDSPYDAILKAGPERLRPILMTSCAMIFGMLPTALARGAGSESRAPMGIAVIGGVISSTLLSLIVVPVVYLALEGLKAWLTSRVSRSSPTKRARKSQARERAQV